MIIVTLTDLPTVFRERAAFLRENAAAAQAATAWERAAIEVEAALWGHEREALSLREAASENGYSPDPRDGLAPTAFSAPSNQGLELGGRGILGDRKRAVAR
jgi:hypothetical protein